MMKTLAYTSVAFITLLIIALLGWWFTNQNTPQTDDQKPTTAITTFEECAAAGNVILESYPPQCRTKDGQSFTQDIGNELSLHDQIRISSPRPQAIISNPLKITGEARGPWFFEAQFPLRYLMKIVML